MKLETTHPNYCATVIEVKTLLPLENCDNLQWMPVFWFQAIVSNETKVWDIGILFSAETQISFEFLSNNNLFRHSDLNKDTTQKWYFEDNRRVKAMKFRWNRSSAFFIPLQSLSYLGKVELEVWDTFNTINWIEVCTKYMLEKERKANRIAGKLKRFERIDNKVFPEHLDSDNFWRNEYKYQPNDRIIITQKLHGTSGRFWYKRVKRLLTFIEKILKFFGVKINNEEYDYIYGSRRVIKNWTTTSEQQGFYATDVWKTILDRYKEVIPKDYILYWEVIGYDWEKPIQNNYTYDLQPWELELYIYRISIVNEDWFITDLSWEAIKEFSINTWIKYCPEISIMKYSELDIDLYMNKRYNESWIIKCVPLSDKTLPDEWVIIRTEWVVPYLTKAKCPDFLEAESKRIDKWEVDMETEES